MSQARSLDQFYTHPRIAKSCWTRLKPLLRACKAATYLEPSADSGAFLSLMPAKRRIGLDLDPQHPEVVKTDFFDWSPADAEVGRVVTVGNPPFGKNASLAVRFFNHAAGFSQLVAFIVPKSFRKPSVQKRLHANFHLVLDDDLPENSFVFNGQPYDVPCCFQVWVRKAELRQHVDSPLEHEDFEFAEPSDAHFAVRRVGARAGAVIEDFGGYSPASHYYIKARRLTAERVADTLRRVDWSCAKANNAGNPSVSKRELVALYERTKARNAAKFVSST